MRTLRSTPPLAGSLLVLLCLGCTEGTIPITPPDLPPDVPPHATNGFIWGHVLGPSSGVCLTGAVVEIIAGPGTGQKGVQTEPCDAWSYVAGYAFHNLPVGATVTLRATRQGYVPQERETVARTTQLPFQFELSPEH